MVYTLISSDINGDQLVGRSGDPSRSLHTTRSVAQILKFVGVVFNDSSDLYIFVADLMHVGLTISWVMLWHVDQ